MNGWKTRTFTEKVCQHHRKVGTAQSKPLKSYFTTGVMDYVMGNHPVWQVFRTIYQLAKQPLVIRGIALGTGYVWAAARKMEHPVSSEFVRFHRREQMQRLRDKLKFKSTIQDKPILPVNQARELR